MHQRAIVPGASVDYFGSADLGDWGIPLVEGTGVREYEMLSTVRDGSNERISIQVNTAGLARFFFRVSGQIPGI